MVAEAQAAFPHLIRFWAFKPPFPTRRLGELGAPDLFKDIPRVPQIPMTREIMNGISLEYIPLRSMARDSFVHTPGSVHFAVLVPIPASQTFAPIGATLVEEYRGTFAQVMNINGGITQLDLQFNNLRHASPSDRLAFVKSFQDEIASETLLSPLTLSSVINGDTIHVQEPVAGQDNNIQPSEVSDPSTEHRRQNLLHHINYLRRDFQKAWKSQVKSPLKSRLAHSMFFDALAVSIPESSTVASSIHGLFVSSLPRLPYPLYRLLRNYDRMNLAVTFSSNVPGYHTLSLKLIPDRPPKIQPSPPDFIRMLIQGASLVRLANQHLDPFKREKTFILVCVFVRNEGTIDWLTLFQSPAQGDRVLYTQESEIGYLDTFSGRAAFALRLYNLLNKIDIEKTEEDRGLEPTTEDALQASNDLGFLGYEIIPDHILATDGTDFDTIDPLPKHLFTVFQPSFPHTRYVAKKIYKDSDEIKILQFLNSLSPSCQNIIRLSASFRGRSGTLWGLFPKLPSSVEQYLHYSPEHISAYASSICIELIGAVAFLHEHKIAHCDLKPANLLLTEAFSLKVIDFDLAVQVKDEDDEISDDRGTRGWVAPEIREKRSQQSDQQDDSIGLSSYAKRLTLDSPDKRPSLSQWLPQLQSTKDVTERPSSQVVATDMKRSLSSDDETIVGDQELPNAYKKSKVVGAFEDCLQSELMYEVC
ncbi:hypothetical protein ONZ45_g2588 [Pleurotus djamor]|nr:hypothetical protein ONZ45_g2588 [Pleurotus djamor]